MTITARKNNYGFYTLCKGKDKNGNELKCYLSVQFKKGYEPSGDVAYIDIEDAFFSCYADRNGNMLPKLIVMSWYPNEKVESSFVDTDHAPEETPKPHVSYDDLPF